MKCNGCGGDIDSTGDLGGFVGYGNASVAKGAQHIKELCPKCTRVMKSILLNSDLSDHWENEDVIDDG
jgi:hypothetical protein